MSERKGVFPGRPQGGAYAMGTMSAAYKADVFYVVEWFRNDPPGRA